MTYPALLDQYGGFGWFRWVAAAMLAWEALGAAFILAVVSTVLFGWTPETGVSDMAALRAMAAWQIPPWLLVLGAYVVAGFRLVRRQSALNFWLVGFSLTVCLALINSAAGEDGRLFQTWPDAAVLEGLIRPAMAGVMVFMADMNAEAWRLRRALRGE